MGGNIVVGDNGVFRLGNDGIGINKHRAKRLVAAVGRRPCQRYRTADVGLVVEVGKRRPDGRPTEIGRVKIGRIEIGRINNADDRHTRSEGGEDNGRLATSDLCATATHAETR
mgnify:CR=1 FL=1